MSSDVNAMVRLFLCLQASFQSKYGGISPKKPLINKDHERAYFDSADWVLGKQGVSSNSTTTVPATEPLKPKLQELGSGTRAAAQAAWGLAVASECPSSGL
ncbi:hypothetical protein BAE44_0002396 [Dichanthelium oligosanthes]|uniref:Negatively light-regulated protein n=1 Tax=Dichanthelium oligosanthes TaxID=888268 RepID=A0A1E5WGR1_9POAL|nr:hypothetical protein BAE44_0002396 [Dichanthelium oligosanthes]